MNCVVLDSEYINQAPDHILIVCDQPDFPSSKALVQYLQMVYPNAIMTSVDSINKALKIIHGQPNLQPIVILNLQPIHELAAIIALLLDYDKATNFLKNSPTLKPRKIPLSISATAAWRSPSSHSLLPTATLRPLSPPISRHAPVRASSLSSLPKLRLPSLQISDKSAQKQQNSNSLNALPSLLTSVARDGAPPTSLVSSSSFKPTPPSSPLKLSIALDTTDTTTTTPTAIEEITRPATPTTTTTASESTTATTTQPTTIRPATPTKVTTTETTRPPTPTKPPIPPIQLSALATKSATTQQPQPTTTTTSTLQPITAQSTTTTTTQQSISPSMKNYVKKFVVITTPAIRTNLFSTSKSDEHLSSLISAANLEGKLLEFVMKPVSISKLVSVLQPAAPPPAARQLFNTTATIQSPSLAQLAALSFSHTNSPVVKKLALNTSPCPSPRSGNSSCILVVEDNIINLKVITRHLAKLGFDSEVADDGYEAVKLVTERNATYSLIFMDLQMPVMDGFLATAKIREYEKKNGLEEIPIIALTANTMDGIQEQCEEAGMNGYISKPVQVSGLVDILHKFLL